MKMSLFEILSKLKIHSFTTPSHSQGGFLIPALRKFLGDRYLKLDLSENDGLDNLSNPKTILKEAQTAAALVYGAKQSFYLVNGSTSGVIAAIMACAGENDKVLVARNCHRSVFSALVLTGAKPSWIVNEKDYDFDILKPISYEQIEKSIKLNPDAKALVLTNPTYEGLCHDIEQIAELCKRYRIKLIVDEAHGALWAFSPELPSCSIDLGADIVIQSLHKTAGAINPSAIMHISQTSEIEPEKLQKTLNLTVTSSPSFPVIANIEACIDFLSNEKGEAEVENLLKNIAKLKKTLALYDEISVYEGGNDYTKLLIKINGLSGYDLSKILYSKYKIEDEMANSQSILLVTGLGTSAKQLKNLENALIKIAKAGIKSENPLPAKDLPAVKMIYTPRRAFFRDYKTVEAENAVGKVSYEEIIPHPPCAPILLPGEKIEKEHLEYLKSPSIKIIN